MSREAPLHLRCPSCKRATLMKTVRASSTRDNEYIRRVRVCADCHHVVTSVETIEKTRNVLADSARIVVDDLTRDEVRRIREVIVTLGYLPVAAYSQICSLMLQKTISDALMTRVVTFIGVELQRERRSKGARYKIADKPPRPTDSAWI